MPRRPSRELPVALPADVPAASAWFRNLQISGFTVTAFVLIIGALVVLAPSLRVLVEQRQEIVELETRVTAQESAVTGLEEEIDRWADPAYIESQARDRLLYVKPGDISYLVIDDGATVESGLVQPISDDIQTTRIDWSQAVLDSLLTAGLTALPAVVLAPVDPAVAP